MLIVKILYLASNAVKFIVCRMTYNIYVCSVYKVDYRGAAAPNYSAIDTNREMNYIFSIE